MNIFSELLLLVCQVLQLIDSHPLKGDLISICHVEQVLLKGDLAILFN